MRQVGIVLVIRHPAIARVASVGLRRFALGQRIRVVIIVSRRLVGFRERVRSVVIWTGLAALPQERIGAVFASAGFARRLRVRAGRLPRRPRVAARRRRGSAAGVWCGGMT